MILWKDNGCALIHGYLFTPADAVRMLIRAMGADPFTPEFEDVPARIVARLLAVREEAKA